MQREWIRTAVCLLAASCAAERPLPAPARPLPPLARSSIAAVLEHTGELALSEDQISRLEAIDRRLEETNSAIRSELAARRKGAATPGAEPTPGGMGRGGGRGRGMGGGGRGGGRPPEASHEAGPEQRLDDNDTHAFLEAEPIFTAEQLPKAEGIASHYREQLFDRRHRADGP